VDIKAFLLNNADRQLNSVIGQIRLSEAQVK